MTMIVVVVVMMTMTNTTMPMTIRVDWQKYVKDQSEKQGNGGFLMELTETGIANTLTIKLKEEHSL